MLYSVAAFLTFYLAVWIYDLKNYTALMMNDLCSTFIYIVPAGLNCLISLEAISIGFFISARLKPHVARQREAIQNTENKNEISI